MKRLLATIALMATGIVCAGPAPYPLTVNSRAQTAPPVIAYAGNETVYRVSYTDGDTASAIGAGEIPFFAWATNNSAAVNSTSSYAIVAGTTGTVDFTFSPAAVNYAAGRYIYETGVKASNGNNRVYRQGTFQIYGSPIGSGVASVTWATNMNWAAINWQNLPTWLSTPAVTPAQTSGWVTASHDGFITTETLATNRVTRWYDPELSSRWAEWDGGTNIVIYKAEVSGTNFVVELSADFEATGTRARPAWTNHVWPFVEGVWIGDQLFLEEFGIDYDNGTARWLNSGLTYPMLLVPSLNASGTATVSIASFNLTTNVEWRYFLPTNAIPKELSNLDELQGWLNNLYAGKTAFDGHVTDGTHTNVTLAGTVTIGGVTRTDWPAGTPGAITNNMAGAVLGGLVVSNNLDTIGSTTIGGDTTYNTWQKHLYQAVYPQFPDQFAQGIRFENALGRELALFHVASDGNGGITFWTGINTSSQRERMRIKTTSGFVGINTNDPAVNLHVNGDVLITSNLFSASYSFFDPGSNCYWRVTASNGLFYASDTNGVRRFKFVTEAP